MKDFAEEKLKGSVSDRKLFHERFRGNCATYEDFLALQEKAFAEGAVSRKHKELMALSISIVTKCEPCIEWHAQQAMLNGATDKEIYETIDVAIEMGGGPASAYARFALHAMDFHRG